MMFQKSSRTPGHRESFTFEAFVGIVRDELVELMGAGSTEISIIPTSCRYFDGGFTGVGKQRPLLSLGII